MTSWVQDAGLFVARYWLELASIAAIVTGALLLMTIYAQREIYPGVPVISWAERVFGWTAPWVAVTLALAGVLGLGRGRAGYWSVEALIGAELMLLALQVGSSVRLTNLPDWTPPGDGSGGGVVGWALGTLLVAGFGRGLALLIAWAGGFVAALLLVRYTPLIYLLAWLVASAQPILVQMRRSVRRAVDAAAPSRESPTRHTEANPAAAGRAPAAVKFVPPEAPALRPTMAGTGADATPADAGLPPFLRREPPAPNTHAPQPPIPSTTRGKSTKTRSPAVPAPVTPSQLPSLDLLAADSGVHSQKDVNQIAERIEQVLGELGIPVRVVHVESGPTVTQFGVEPLFIERGGVRRKVRVNQITALADDLALALATPSVRMEAPVAGRNFVGIEIPNLDKSLVSLRGIMESPEFGRHGGALGLPLGRNTSGQAVVLDLTRAPHMLIAGATGSGKSVCINTLIMGMILRHGPDALRFILVDPKRVELAGYGGIPHLMGQVITDVEKVMPALTWLTLQMDDRYMLFREAGVRHIDAYNEWARKQPRGEGAPQPLPYVVLIVDELADLMMTAPEDIERLLCRLAQKARATGIHLILATQRPSVDVVTGLIKANFPTRIAFAVTSQIDSRVILDTPGAERLLGRGDMLLMRPDAGKLLRVQGCLVTDDEINRTVDFWQTQAALADSSGHPSTSREPWADLIGRDEETDELVEEAIDLLQGLQTCSVSLLQRRLRIGYPRAARLMEVLERQGIVGPEGGSQGREVLLGMSEDPPQSTTDLPPYLAETAQAKG